MTVVNLEVQTMEPVVFAPEGPIIEVNVEENKQEINHYVESIKQAETTKEVKIKKVVKVEKEVNAFYEKVFTKFIDENDKTQVVTMIIQPGEKPIVVNVDKEEEEETTEEETIEEEEEEPTSEVSTIDVNGNTVVKVTGSKTITQKVDTKISHEKVVTTHKELKDFKVVTGKTIDYGTVQEVDLVFKNKVTKELVKSVTIYNKDTNVVEVISVEPVDEPVDSGDEPEVSTG